MSAKSLEIFHKNPKQQKNHVSCRIFNVETWTTLVLFLAPHASNRVIKFNI